MAGLVIFGLCNRVNRRGEGNGYRITPLDPLGPTDALPGTEEKMVVMSDRAARGVCLFHPLDGTWNAAPVTLAGTLQPHHNDHHYHANGHDRR
jgi:hypothetical protein